MSTISTTRRFHVWMTILVMLAAAWMPTVSQWLSASHTGGDWVELCTGQGSRWVQLDLTQAKLSDATDPKNDPAQDNLQMEHCAFCLLQAHGVGLPPTDLVVAVDVLAGEAMLPPLFLHAPHQLFAWSPALARAPPHLS